VDAGNGRRETRGNLISRRALLRSAFLGGAGLAGAYLLGCGDDDGGADAQPTLGLATTTPGGPPTVAAPALRWRQLSPSGLQPPPRRDHSLVTEGERIFLFGGRNDTGDLADLWSYHIEAREWTELAPTGPAARHGHNAIWNDLNHRMVAFGGQAGGFFNDLWAFDPEEGAWLELPGSGSGPAARYGAGGAFDPAGRLIVTHGFTAEGRFDDTWQYDFAAGMWTDISPTEEPEIPSPTGERPVERCLMRAIWDTLRNRVLIYGGQTNGTPFLDDLWALSDDGWNELPRLPRPSARTLYAMVFDGRYNKTVLFGGDTADGPVNDLWFLDAQNEFWTRMEGEGEPPSPRSGHDAVWLPDFNSFVFFGGNDGSADLNDMWELSPGA